MHLVTTRFGAVDVDDSRIIKFPAGLLGFSNFKRYVLLQPEEDGVFYWLQSVDAPDLAFVVTDPSMWVREYEVPIRREQIDELGLDHIDEAQVFVIVNKYERTLTANLQGPLVVNTATRQASQLVLADRRWTTRHEILQLKEALEAVPA